jgi:hypothetical protein
LINTRLIPDLTTKAFEVLPVGRVGGDLPPGIDPDNVFSYNLMLSLDRSEKNIERFAQLILTDFLANLVVTNGKCYYDDGETLEATDDDSNDEGYEIWPRALIIDQFEEILTTNLQAWKEREGFFRQLCQGMEDDPYLWIILVIREDFVAGLDPYAYLLPNKLRARFHMQRMSYEAALEAVKKPAKKYGCPFAPGVAEILVDNLRQIRVLGTTTTSTGQFVEPVQLQVVCHQLWENLKERLADQITEQDLEDAGDVDTALATFYEQAIRKTLPQTDILEAELRNWFDQKLITEAGTRGTVYQGATDTAGLPNLVVRLLANQFLLRADIRAGSTWYELVHDRFIEPILQANRAWWQKQDPVIRAVHAGKESSKEEYSAPCGLQKDHFSAKKLSRSRKANVLCRNIPCF